MQIVNLNDCIYNGDLLGKIHHKLNSGWKTIVLASYSPAGPYPHSYLNTRGKKFKSISARFKRRYLEEYKEKCLALKADYGIPCAGGFRFSNEKFNKDRNYPNYIEALNSYRCIDGWKGYNYEVEFSSDKGERISRLEYKLMEQTIGGETKKNKSLPTLNHSIISKVEKAYKKACRYVKTDIDYRYIIPFKEGISVILPINGGELKLAQSSCLKKIIDSDEITTHVVIISNGMFQDLIDGKTHWDNAEKGALYLSSRNPDKFVREAQAWLHYFNTI